MGKLYTAKQFLTGTILSVVTVEKLSLMTGYPKITLVARQYTDTILNK
jgi:hypothetical protein